MQVVLVAENPNGRVAKIAYGLKSAGCEVILLHKNALNAESRGDYFHEVHAFHDENEALRLAANFRPAAFHVFSLNIDMTSVAFVKERPGKVVFDVYDTCEGIAYEWAVQGKPYQRYCLENADGVCARDLRLRWLRRDFSYRYRNVILFLDYCWARPQPLLPKISSDEVHLVAVGYIHVEKLGYLDHQYLQVARDLADEGVHLHLYPNPMQAATMRETFSEYFELQSRVPYLHMHAPVPFDRMTAEISQYHGGVAFNGGYLYGEPVRDYDENHHRYTSASRMFDYLEAGLPVLDNRERFRFRFHLAVRYGLAIDATIELLGSAGTALRPLLSPGLQARADRVREAYSVRRQARRLGEFYKSL
jgi:hypothetical protein